MEHKIQKEMVFWVNLSLPNDLKERSKRLEYLKEIHLKFIQFGAKYLEHKYLIQKDNLDYSKLNFKVVDIKAAQKILKIAKSINENIVVEFKYATIQSLIVG